MYEVEYTHTKMLNNLYPLTRIMAVFPEATGADFKDTNINIRQKPTHYNLSQQHGGSRGENVSTERKKEKVSQWEFTANEEDRYTE